MAEYEDFDGNPCTLDALCDAEPEWAANRIRALLTEGGKLKEALLEAMEWNWCDDDYPENLRDEFYILATGSIDPDTVPASTRQESDEKGHERRS